MSSIIVRGTRLYVKFRDVDGTWRRGRTDFVVGQEAAALAWLADRDREIADEIDRRAGRPVTPAALTLNAWAATWAAKRAKLGIEANHDYPRLRNHILPTLGEMPIKTIEPKHVVDLFDAIRTTPIKAAKGMEPPAPRTVYNVYSALCACFRDARLAGHIATTPCILTEYQLGVKVDKDREWRSTAVFTRDELVTLISTSKIPWDRRVAYALELLAGRRPGEVAALRWRHYDPSQRPLGSLQVVHALDTKRGTIKGTKTSTETFVPVHATLAAMLAEWKLGGWESQHGRAPGPDDLIVPLPPRDAAARTKRASAEAFRTYYYAGRRWREDDLPALGWRDRRHYDMRATFITLALEDGADEHVLETRVTHKRRSRGAFQGYNRGNQWAIVCAEVAKLRIVREDLRAVASASGGDLGPSLVQACQVPHNDSASQLRRRVSNPSLVSDRDEPCESIRVVADGESPPNDTVEHVVGPRLVQASCDAGMLALIAAARAT